MVDSMLKERFDTGEFGDYDYPSRIPEPIAIYDCNARSLVKALSSRNSNHFWNFLDGSEKQQNLKEYLESRNEVDFMSNLSIMCQLSDAFNFLHRQEPPIIMGCVNPEAIFMKWSTENEPMCRIEVPDYHELKQLDERRRRCVSTAFRKGTKWDETCHFLAPDLCWDLSVSSCTIAADIFSLGLLFVLMFWNDIKDYEMISLSGRFWL